MKRTLYLAALTLLCACGGNPGRPTAAGETAAADCVQVLYFHGKQRCVTCNAIERLTREVVDSMGRDGVVMRVIDLNEDESLADQYEVTWSSLILDRDGRVENLTQMGFGYAKDQPGVFKTRLTEAIERMAR